MSTIEKIISFIVPAYNSEKTLRECLDSFILDGLEDKVEIIVVNDGSTDSTPDIAREYEAKYSNFILINKENGGHGSTINVGTKKANGKYFKVIDSDDYIYTKNLSSYIRQLEKIDVDIVLTNFITKNINSDAARAYKPDGIAYKRKYGIDSFCRRCTNLSSICRFHALTYNTAFYNYHNFTLSEKIFYEDQEFATLPFAKAKNICALDLTIYNYNVGNPNQSVAPKNLIKNIKHMQQVLFRLIKEHPVHGSSEVKDFFLMQQKEALLYLYITSMLKNENKISGRIFATKLRSRVRKYNYRLYILSSKSFFICYLLSYTGFDHKTMEILQRYSLYRKLTKFTR